MSYIKKEDYDEPCCVLKTYGRDITAIPLERVIERLDLYLEKNDLEGAKRHLDYWYREAESGGDMRGELSVANEQIGLFRKNGQRDEALSCCDKALFLLKKLSLEGSVTEATTCINVATAYKAFGMAEDAMPYYAKARKIYEKELYADDERIAGLYNNTALCAEELGDLETAEALFRKALAIVEKAEDGGTELAVTYCNLADLFYEKLGAEQSESAVSDCLSRAYAALDGEALPHCGHYAFVCKKCASAFRYHGRFVEAAELERRADEIYERA